MLDSAKAPDSHSCGKTWLRQRLGTSNDSVSSRPKEWPIGFGPKECLLTNSLLSTSVIFPRLRQYSSGGLVFGSKGDLAWSAA